jgi:flavin reductase (DIM6/NTAB) family NADH-FMN oxidoreductase RutF
MSHSTVPRAQDPGAWPDTDHEQQQFRCTMAELPAGVPVLTTTSAAGPVGMTTSAVTSLSMEPQLLLACVANQSGALTEIQRHEAFAVNVLADTMADTSQGFAQGPCWNGSTAYLTTSEREFRSSTTP